MLNVNGGLFADENIEIPNFTEDVGTLLLEKASMAFDWNGISPTIFVTVFESTFYHLWSDDYCYRQAAGFYYV